MYKQICNCSRGTNTLERLCVHVSCILRLPRVGREQYEHALLGEELFEVCPFFAHLTSQNGNWAQLLHSKAELLKRRVMQCRS